MQFAFAAKVIQRTYVQYNMANSKINYFNSNINYTSNNILSDIS